MQGIEMQAKKAFDELVTRAASCAGTVVPGDESRW
jgi:hypothetical protein